MILLEIGDGPIEFRSPIFEMIIVSRSAEVDFADEDPGLLVSFVSHIAAGVDDKTDIWVRKGNKTLVFVASGPHPPLVRLVVHAVSRVED